MKTYKIRIKLDNNEFDTEIEKNNWEEVCDYVFGHIEIIDKEDNDN